MSSLIRYVATLAKMPAAEYKSNQQAAIDNRLLDDKSIEDEAMRYWSEIDGQSYAFRRAEEEAEAMRATSQQLLVRWLRESFLSPQTAKRLVVAIAPGTAPVATETAADTAATATAATAATATVGRRSGRFKGGGGGGVKGAAPSVASSPLCTMNDPAATQVSDPCSFIAGLPQVPRPIAPLPPLIVG
jgi:hypothetical protein